MLGLARASQLAGWGQIPPAFSSSTTSTMLSATSWDSGRTVDNHNTWTSPLSGDNLSSSFDTTSLSNGNKVTHIQTVQLATADNFVFREDSVDTNYNYLAADGMEALTQHTPFFVYLNEADREFIPVINPKLGQHSTSGDFSLLIDWGSYFWCRFDGIAWDDLADKWITIMCSISTTQADFVNHNPPETFGNMYGRITIADAGTGELIVQRDLRLNQFNAPFTDYTSRTWRYRSTSGDSATAWFYSQIRSGAAIDTGDILVAAGWAALGEMIDPGATISSRPAYQYFVGQRFPETVNGVRAWVNWSGEVDSTSGSDTLLPRMLGCRVTTTDSVWSKMPTSGLSTPTISTDKP